MSVVHQTDTSPWCLLPLLQVQIHSEPAVWRAATIRPLYRPQLSTCSRPFPKPSPLFSILFRGTPSSVHVLQHPTAVSFKRARLIPTALPSAPAPYSHAREKSAWNAARPSGFTSGRGGKEERSGWNRIKSVRWEAGMSLRHEMRGVSGGTGIKKTMRYQTWEG